MKIIKFACPCGNKTTLIIPICNSPVHRGKAVFMKPTEICFQRLETIRKERQPNKKQLKEILRQERIIAERIMRRNLR